MSKSGELAQKGYKLFNRSRDLIYAAEELGIDAGANVWNNLNVGKEIINKASSLSKAARIICFVG